MPLHDALPLPLKRFLRSIPPHRLLLGAIDALLVGTALALAYLLRFDFSIPDTEDQYYAMQLKAFLPWVIVGQLVIFALFGLYRGMLRYASVNELVSIILATATGVAVLAVANVILQKFDYLGSFPVMGVGDQQHVMRIPYGLLVFFFFTLVVSVGGFRFSRRLWVVSGQRFEPDAKRILVVGAGDLGESVIRSMLADPSSGLRPVAIATRHKKKIGMRLHALPIVCHLDDISKVVARDGVQEVVVAMEDVTPEELRVIVSQCESASLKVNFAPSLGDVMSGRVSVSTLRPIQIEDLLAREPVRLEIPPDRDYIKGEKVLITGAGGSIGSELCRQVLAYGPRSLILLGKGENSIYEIHDEIRAKAPLTQIALVIGDVRDPDKMARVFDEFHPTIIFHAAAHKHVPLMESAPDEAVKNNIVGTAVIAHLAHLNRAKKFILVSTDKAVRPTSVMGSTKRVAEQIVFSLARESKTMFCAVRFGNVLGSRGSVIPLFKRQIERGGPVTVTHPEVTRYFMTIPEAVSLMLQTGAIGRGGQLFVLDMGKPIRIADLARNLIVLSGLKPDVDVKIEFIGLRPGEKLKEDLLSASEGVSKTELGKVFTATPDAAPAWNEMMSRVQAISDAATKGEPSVVRALLAFYVPDYRPEKIKPMSPEEAAKALSGEETEAREVETGGIPGAADEPHESDRSYRSHRSREASPSAASAAADQSDKSDKPAKAEPSAKSEKPAPPVAPAKGEPKTFETPELFADLQPPSPKPKPAMSEPPAAAPAKSEPASLWDLDDDVSSAAPTAPGRSEKPDRPDGSDKSDKSTKSDEPAQRPSGPVHPDSNADPQYTDITEAFSAALDDAFTVVHGEDGTAGADGVPSTVDPANADLPNADPAAVDSAAAWGGESDSVTGINLLGDDAVAPGAEADTASERETGRETGREGIAEDEISGEATPTARFITPEALPPDAPASSLGEEFRRGDQTDHRADQTDPTDQIDRIDRSGFAAPSAPATPPASSFAPAAPPPAAAAPAPPVSASPSPASPAPAPLAPSGESPSRRLFDVSSRPAARVENRGTEFLVLYPIYSPEQPFEPVINAFLEQRPGNFMLEILDATPDGLSIGAVQAAMRDDSRIRLDRGDYFNPAQMINRAMEAHREARYLIALPHGVTPLPDCLAEIEQAFRRDEDLACVFADFNVLTSARGHIQRVELLDWTPGVIHERHEFGFLQAWRLQALREVDGIREDLRFAADYDLMLRLTDDWTYQRIRKPLAVVAEADLILPADPDLPDTSRLRLPGEPLFGGYSYLFYPAEIEEEVASVFEQMLHRRGFWIDPKLQPVPTIPALATDMDVSVLIPAQNGERLIANAIQKILHGTHQSLEILVADAGSADRTREVVQRFMARDRRVRLIVDESGSRLGAINQALRQARGRYVAHLEWDDELAPNCLEKMVAWLKAHPQCAMAVSHYEIIDEEGNPVRDIPPVTHKTYSPNQLLRHDGIGAARMVPRGALKHFNYYQVRNYSEGGEDYDLALKISEQFEIGRVPEVLYRRRQWEGRRAPTLARDKNLDYARLEAIRRRRELNRGRG